VVYPSPGVVGVSESSLLTPAALDALQGSSFTLATLDYTGLKAGTSFNGGLVFSVDDANGNELLGFGDGIDRGVYIDVVIPGPPAAVTFAVGLVSVGAALRRSAGNRR
jgi:hypothetical protein